MPELKSTHIYIYSFYSGHGRRLKLTLSLKGYFCAVFSSKSFIQIMYSPGDPVREPSNPGLLTSGLSTWIEKKKKHLIIHLH